MIQALSGNLPTDQHVQPWTDMKLRVKFVLERGGDDPRKEVSKCRTTMLRHGSWSGASKVPREDVNFEPQIARYIDKAGFVPFG